MNNTFDYDAAAEHVRELHAAAIALADDMLHQTDHPDLYPIGYRPEHAQNARAIARFRAARKQVAADDRVILEHERALKANR